MEKVILPKSPHLPRQLSTFRYSALLLLIVLCSAAQAQLVKGKISDEAGAGLPGVNVIVKGTASGTVSDADGNYSITLPEGSKTLVFSFIGYATQEVNA